MILRAVTGALVSYGKITLIIVPVLLAIEVMRDLRVIDYVSKWLKPLTSRLKLADEGTLLVAIGMIFGLTYGAGAIIQSAKDGRLDNRSMIIVGVFLATCHALIEDSVLFSAMGANVVVVMVVRFVTAAVLSYLIARKIGEKKKIA